MQKKLGFEHASAGVKLQTENGHLISANPKGSGIDGSYTAASGEAPRKGYSSEITKPEGQAYKSL